MVGFAGILCHPAYMKKRLQESSIQTVGLATAMLPGVRSLATGEGREVEPTEATPLAEEESGMPGPETEVAGEAVPPSAAGAEKADDWGEEPAPGGPEPVSEPGALVIEPGQEELLAAIVGRGKTLPGGCKLTEGQIDRTVIRGTYGCSSGDVVIEWKAIGDGSDPAAVSEKFGLFVVKGAPPDGFLDALVAEVRANEATFQWKATIREETPGVTSLAPMFLVGLGLIAAGWALWRWVGRR